MRTVTQETSRRTLLRSALIAFSPKLRGSSAGQLIASPRCLEHFRHGAEDIRCNDSTNFAFTGDVYTSLRRCLPLTQNCPAITPFHRQFAPRLEYCVADSRSV